jgi:serine/threonine protein kinase
MTSDVHKTRGPDFASTDAAPPDEGPDDRFIGTRIGKYHIVRRLGRGGMGVVYEARDPVLQRAVAIKVLRDAIAIEPEALRKFLREARAAARLNHPHVVGVYDTGEEDGHCYLVMELMEGGSAHDRIHKWGPFNWVEATRVMADACRGLMAVHAAGLIHRDIKPSNIMRSFDGTVKIADFGLALGPTDLGIPGRIIGTPFYMSPEQCRAERVDIRSDIYAVGATYYTLLTGKPPFDSKSAAEIMIGHCSGPIPNPSAANPEIPAACGELISWTMAKSPEDRPANAAALFFELDALAATVDAPPNQPLDWSETVGTPFGTTLVEPVQPVRAPRQSPSWWFWLAAAGIVGIAIAYGLSRQNAEHLPTTQPESPRAAVSPPGTKKSESSQPREGPAPKHTEFDAGGAVISLAFDPRDVDQLSWAAGRAGARVHRTFFRNDRFAATSETGIPGPTSQVGFAPVERLWAVLSDRRIYFRETDGYLPVLEGDAFQTLGTRSILTSVFHPRERIIALAYGDSETGKGGFVLRWLRATPQDVDCRTADELPPTCLAFSADGTVLLQGKAGGIVAAWKVSFRPKPFSEELAIAGEAAGAVKLGNGPITAIVGADGTRFAVAIGNQVILVDGLMGEKLSTVATGEGAVTALAFSPATRRLAAAFNKEVAVFDLATSAKTAEWKGHSHPVTALAFDVNGARLASGDEGGKIVIRAAR